MNNDQEKRRRYHLKNWPRNRLTAWRNATTILKRRRCAMRVPNPKNRHRPYPQRQRQSGRKWPLGFAGDFAHCGMSNDYVRCGGKVPLLRTDLWYWMIRLLLFRSELQHPTMFHRPDWPLHLLCGQCYNKQNSNKKSWKKKHLETPTNKLFSFSKTLKQLSLSISKRLQELITL